jgi:hypothetical protein
MATKNVALAGCSAENSPEALPSAAGPMPTYLGDGSLMCDCCGGFGDKQRLVWLVTLPSAKPQPRDQPPGSVHNQSKLWRLSECRDRVAHV